MQSGRAVPGSWYTGKRAGTITRNAYTPGKGELAWDTWPNRVVLRRSLRSENKTNDPLKSGPALAGPAGPATSPLLFIILFSYQVLKLWNCLPADVVLCSSIGSFKNKIRSLYTCYVCYSTSFAVVSMCSCFLFHSICFCFYFFFFLSKSLIYVQVWDRLYPLYSLCGQFY